MTPTARRDLSDRRRRAGLSAVFAACFLGLAWSSISNAQGPTSAAKTLTKPAAEQGARWSELKPAQQASLKPLEREWPGIDSRSKQKWLELSSRFSKLTPDEQARVQERMGEWAKLTPRERGEARMHFQEAKQLPPQDRQARWKAYEALSPEQKQQFAARAAPAASAPETARKAGLPAGRADKAARDTAPQAKSNIVPNPSFAAPPRAIAPTVVQARPGATTTLITRRATPPGHQQTGMPKIAATPEFVNKATLLPRRGPQGAATRSAAAASSEAAARQ
ncbi:MAG: DUF3106 domain-containing protein [Burkholderiales bacterium]